MENNCEKEEEKYFSNGMILNKLGDTREFGNFYELCYNRKLKVLSFLNKDITQLTNPDLRQFESLGHAYDIFLSFHVFYPYLYEDCMFMHTLETCNIEADIKKCIEELELYTEENNSHGLVSELILYHDLRLFKSNNEVEEVTVKKRNLTRRNTIIRLKSTDRKSVV